MTPAERATIRDRMRVPVICFFVLLACLAVIVLLGALNPPGAAYAEIAVVLAMIATVLFFTMEVRHEAPLTRFFALVGFAWVLILIGMTTLDYISR